MDGDTRLSYMAHSPRRRRRDRPSARRDAFAASLSEMMSKRQPDSLAVAAAPGDNPADKQKYRTLQSARWRLFEEVIVERSVEALADLAATEAARGACSANMPLEVLALNVRDFPRCVSSNSDFVVGDWGEASAEQWFYATNGTAIAFREGTPVPYIELLESFMPRLFEKARELGFASCSRVPNTWTITISWLANADAAAKDAASPVAPPGPLSAGTASDAPAPSRPASPARPAPRTDELPPTSPGTQFLQMAGRLEAPGAPAHPQTPGSEPNMEALLDTFRSQFPEQEQLERFVSQITGAAKAAVSTWRAGAATATPAVPTAPAAPADLVRSGGAVEQSERPIARSRARDSRPSSSQDCTATAERPPRARSRGETPPRRRMSTRADRRVDALVSRTRAAAEAVEDVRAASRQQYSGSRSSGSRSRSASERRAAAVKNVRARAAAAPARDDDLESVTDSDKESVRSRSRSAGLGLRGGQAGVCDESAAAAAAAAKATEAKDNLVRQLNEWKVLMMQIKDCERVTTLHKDLEAKDEAVLARIRADIEAEQSALASSIDTAWDGYASHSLSDPSGEEARHALKRMRGGIADAHTAADKICDILQSENQPLAQIQTASVRKKASQLFEEKTESLRESRAELMQWAPLLKNAPLDKPRDRPHEARARPLGVKGLDRARAGSSDPLAQALLRRGVIVSHEADRAQLPDADSAIQTAINRAADYAAIRERDPDCDLAGLVVREGKEIRRRMLCKGHGHVAVIKRAKARGGGGSRRFLCCPVSEKFGGCGFQRWLDKAGGRGAARQDSEGSEAH